MPFEETDRVKEREELIRMWRSGEYVKSELARRFDVSRPTVDLWISRDACNEPLCDRSRAPRHCPHRTEERIVEHVLAVRGEHPHWGPKKIVAVLERREPAINWPAPSTIGDWLSTRGLTSPRVRRNPKNQPSSCNQQLATRAGQMTTADFKGQFRLQNGRYCYPLTIADPFSRFLYAIEALDRPRGELVQPVFERVFREYGLPEMILTDNGPPFAGSQGLMRLSRLSVWWLKLGLSIHHSRPGHPEDNAIHERMHRTLKAETARPPQRSFLHQQRHFDAFRTAFNYQRPHEALGQRTPGELHQHSPRPFPKRIPEVTYPGHFEVRRVHPIGQISWKGTLLYLSSALAGEWIGLEEVDDGVWSIYFAEHLLGRYREGQKCIV